MKSPSSIEVVDELRTNACATRLGATGQAWINLIEGIAQHRPAVVQAAVPGLLNASANDLPAAQFLIAELLLADIQGDDPQAALAHIQQVSGLSDSPALAYLRAYALAQARSANPETVARVR